MDISSATIGECGNQNCYGAIFQSYFIKYGTSFPICIFPCDETISCNQKLVCGYHLPGSVVEAQRKVEVIVEVQRKVGVRVEVQRNVVVIVEVKRKKDVISELIKTLFMDKAKHY
jgi:hypothetical protein